MRGMICEDYHTPVNSETKGREVAMLFSRYVKVADLIRKLQQCDPEMDVAVSPLTEIPTIQEGMSARVTSPFVRFPVIAVSSIKNLEEDLEYVVLGFDEDGQPARAEYEN